uniref:hypothetical protein n=1 Tax=Nonomuraea sp. CA-251285 TaxID=3240002 RepID=UPI003F492688
MRRPRSVPARQAATYAAARQLLQTGWRGETHTCRCGAPRDAHTGTNHVGGHRPTGCARYARDDAEQAAELMLATAGSNPVHDMARAYALSQSPRKAVHASDAGACPRQVWYRITPPPGYEPAPTVQDEATMGTAIHNEVAAARAHLYPWREYNRPVYIPGIGEEPSSLDQYDEGLGEITDQKTCDDWKWGQVETGPWPKDVAQVLVYGYSVTMEGRVVVTLVLEYIHRATGKVRRHVIPYDHAAATAEVGKLRAMQAALDAGLELPRGEGCTPEESPICRDRCPARLHCWNVEEAARRGRSPVSLTLLGADVRANEPVTAHALANFRETSRAYRQARAAYEVARAMLRGIPDGQYVAHDGTVWAYADASRPPSPNTVGYQAAIARAWTAWLDSPDRDPAALITALSSIRHDRKHEYRPNVTLVKPAVPPIRRAA